MVQLLGASGMARRGEVGRWTGSRDKAASGTEEQMEGGRSSTDDATATLDSRGCSKIVFVVALDTSMKASGCVFGVR